MDFGERLWHHRSRCSSLPSCCSSSRWQPPATRHRPQPPEPHPCSPVVRTWLYQGLPLRSLPWSITGAKATAGEYLSKAFSALRTGPGLVYAWQVFSHWAIVNLSSLTFSLIWKQRLSKLPRLDLNLLSSSDQPWTCHPLASASQIVGTWALGLAVRSI